MYLLTSTNMCITLNDSSNSRCADEKCTLSHNITVAEVKECLQHLKSGKNDGNMGHYTDHLINGTDKLTVMIFFLFTSMLVHSFTP